MNPETSNSKSEIANAGAAPGLGDAIHKVAGPIGRAIGWPCMKGDGTTDLKPESPCARAREFLNNLTSPAPCAPLPGSAEARMWRPPSEHFKPKPKTDK